MEMKDFPGSRELRAYQSKIGYWRDHPLKPSSYEHHCGKLDIIANTGDDQTRAAVKYIKDQMAQRVSTEEPKGRATSRPSTRFQQTPRYAAGRSTEQGRRSEPRARSKQTKPQFYAAREVGAGGYANPSRVKLPSGSGDPSVTVDDCIYYLRGGVPDNWSGKYRVTGTTRWETAFIAEAISETLEQKAAHPRYEKPQQVEVTRREKPIAPAAALPGDTKQTYQKVSLSDVDPDKVIVDEKVHSFLFQGGGQQSTPWEVTLTEEQILEEKTLGDILSAPEPYLRTREQKEGYAAVKAETNTSYDIRLGAKTIPRSTKLIDIVSDSENTKVIFEKVKRGEKTVTRERTVTQPKVAGSARVG